MNRPLPINRIQQAQEILNKLEEQEEIFSQQDIEQNLIRLYEKMHTQLKLLLRVEPKEYTDYERYIQKKLVKAYIKYGTYLKSEQKDFNVAKTSLEKALKLNTRLPIAHYRLVFLAYRRQAHTETLNAFNQAVQVQGEPQYMLTSQQAFNAQLYLTNSVLYIVKEASEPLVNYELSPIFSRLSETEQFMADNSFYCLSERGVEKCALKQCEQLCEVPNTLILYFSDRENVCIYNRKEVPLSVNLADTLRHLLLACSEYNPGIRRQFHTFFERFDDNGEVRADAFRQCISSLHGKLAKIGLTDVIVQARLAGETAYYIKEQLFLVALPRG